MKIRSPWMIRVVSWLGTLVVRGLVGTLRYQYRPIGPDVSPRVLGPSMRFIYSVWHENLLLPTYHYAGPNMYTLVSQHADGELVANLLHNLGFKVVRGSTTRGGVLAVRHCLRTAENGHLVLTPDGPRGPRRQVHDGLIYLASRSGRPIIPVGIGYCRPWRARSWDRFAVPRPWSRARCVSGVPIVIPRDMERSQLAAYRQQVQAAIEHVDALAERWAETGAWPEDLQQQAA